MFIDKPKIVIIGAGKIAYSFVFALKNSGYEISSVVSRNISSAKKLSKKFNINGYSDKLKSLSGNHNIFFLTVPDNQIEKVAMKLALCGLDFSNSLFLHLSGALDLTELSSLKKKGAYTASLHIMQTFPSHKVIDIKGCSAAIETDSKVAKDFLMKVSRKLGLNSFHLKSENKIYYHLAGVFASNFLVGNISASEKMFLLSKAGKLNFLSVIDSIFNSTMANVRKVGVAEALSGPVERGDYETIRKHLKALKKKNKDLYLSYIIQSLHLLNVSKEKKMKNNPGQKEIRKILIKELEEKIKYSNR